ncbi:MAG: DUF3794 domain-containing protein [Clostridia bacterium]|nr:DUF3794 domain-containing protein [Clostridia bacterium]
MEKNMVVINKKMASVSRTLEISGDVIVPDIKPDILNIINTNGIPYIYKEDIGNGRVRLDGNIDTYVVYLADNGETRSIQTTLSFSESVEEATITESSFSRQSVSLEMIEAKVLNERKISIRASMKIKCEVFEKSEIEINNDFNEIENIEMLKETLNIKSVIGSNRVKTSIKEDIELEASYSVAEILKVDVDVSNLENKISHNKVLAKADSNVKIIFLSEDGRIGTANANIPIMSFIDIDKITDSNTCEIDYSVRNMLFKPNTNSITCQVDFEVFAMAYETKTIDVVQDMYGLRNTVEFSRKEVEVELSRTSRKEVVNLNERIVVEDILNVLDVDAKPRIVNKNKVGNSFNCECEMGLDIYYEADNRNGLNVKNVTIPFMIKTENPEDIELIVSKKQFTVSSENVNCDMEILTRTSNNCLKNISMIENVSCKECEEDNDYKMFMYFVKAGDSVWKIAKRFRVPMCDIIELNNLESPERLQVGDRLYIMR